MSPAQCQFAKADFSEDEKIFLGQSCKVKYDMDSMDMGLCLGGDVQYAQPRTNPQCAAWTQI